MAKTVETKSSKITSVVVRMYRVGTGDFLVLKFKSGKKDSFNMMIDCGCIVAKKEEFIPMIENLQEYTNNTIDLLVVTHEHADHINGFQKCSEMFAEMTFKKVWFAWTEDDTDDFANDMRRNHTKMKMAINKATLQLSSLNKKEYYTKLFDGEYGALQKVNAQGRFIESLEGLNSLNNITKRVRFKKIPTMEDIMRDCNVISDKTKVEFLSPGDLKDNMKGLEGIRFFILGPPRDNDAIKTSEKKGEGYEKREHKSEPFFSFIDAVTGSEDIDIIPFQEEFIFTGKNGITAIYQDKLNNWRNIEYDWLYNAGSLALRHERSINNTSLVLAIQFEDSEKVMLFPGDAEHGSWVSWHDVAVCWTIKQGNKTKKVNAEYLLNNTVFYKVGHHLSQNGSGKENGIEMMLQEDMAAMATLDFDHIQSGWLSTMPNDAIGAELIKKTKGKLFFVGDCNAITKNILTDRVKVKKADVDTMKKLNKKFDGEIYIDYEVKGH